MYVSLTEKKRKKAVFVLFDKSPFCKIGYELDLCRSCCSYDLLVDYCEKGLFEGDEKEGERRPVEECLEFFDIIDIQLLN